MIKRQIYQYKLYQHRKNYQLLLLIRLAWEIYNHCLNLHRRYYRWYGKSLPLFVLQKHLSKLKQLEKYHAWKQLGSQAIQDIVERIDTGYQKFFQGKNQRPPQLKSLHKYKSITLKASEWAFVGDNRINIGGQVYKFHHSRPMAGVVKSVTIKRNRLGDWYIYFLCHVAETASERTMSGYNASFDFGVKDFLAARFKMQTLPFPEFLRQYLSQKVKSAKPQQGARVTLARLCQHMANLRRDFHCKFTKQLHDHYDCILLEAMESKDWQRVFGQKLTDLSLDDFVKCLELLVMKLGSMDKINTIDKIDKAKLSWLIPPSLMVDAEGFCLKNQSVNSP